MSNFIVTDGDQVIFTPTFGYRMVTVQPGIIRGSGHATIGGQKVCLNSDISTVRVQNVSYVTATHLQPGLGELTIQSLQSDQLKEWVLSDRPVIVVGQNFNATFTPTSPAKTPPPANADDAMTPTQGMGRFSNGQFFVTAS